MVETGEGTRRSPLARGLDIVLSTMTLLLVPIAGGLCVLVLASYVAKGQGGFLAQLALIWALGAASLPGIALSLYGVYRIVKALGG